MMVIKEITKVIAESDDGEIVKGSVTVLACRFGVSENYIRKSSLKENFYLNDIHGKRFKLYRVTTTEAHEIQSGKRQTVKNIESEIEQTVRLLKEYGNTNISHDPKELIHQLENLGLRVSYRPMTSNKKHYILTLEGYYY